MADEVKKMEEALSTKNWILSRYSGRVTAEEKIEKSADELGFDRKIFQFLVESAIRPSIEATVEQTP